MQDALTKLAILQGTFVPGARVFVSVDNGNGGIGFGSLGALPTDPSFPNHGVEVAYPYAQLNAAYGSGFELLSVRRLGSVVCGL